MERRFFLFSSAACVAALVAQAQTGQRKLIVQVNYTGAGTVNETHKIYVALWDTPDFAKGDPGGPPIATQAISSKSGEAQFDDIPQSTVYIGLVFDPSGNWAADSEPPAGASIGLYFTEPGSPAPIQLQPGKVTKISAKFDDSYKSK